MHFAFHHRSMPQQSRYRKRMRANNREKWKWPNKRLRPAAFRSIVCCRTAHSIRWQRCLIFRILFHYLSLQIKENDRTHTQKRGRKRKKRNKIEFAPIQWQKINAPLINWTDVTQFFFFFYCLFRSILFTIARTKMYIWQFLCWRQTCAPSNESTFTI